MPIARCASARLVFVTHPGLEVFSSSTSRERASARVTHLFPLRLLPSHHLSTRGEPNQSSVPWSHNARSLSRRGALQQAVGASLSLITLATFAKRKMKMPTLASLFAVVVLASLAAAAGIESGEADAEGFVAAEERLALVGLPLTPACQLSYVDPHHVSCFYFAKYQSREGKVPTLGVGGGGGGDRGHGSWQGRGAGLHGLHGGLQVPAVPPRAAPRQGRLTTRHYSYSTRAQPNFPSTLFPSTLCAFPPPPPARRCEFEGAHMQEVSRKSAC
jgi:hypothetical protein